MRRRDRARRKHEQKEIDARLEAMRLADPPVKRTPRSKRKKRRRKRGFLARRLVLVVLLILASVGGFYLLASTAPGGGAVTIVVEKGDALSNVAYKLQEAGVVRSSVLFQLEARLQEQETEIKAGEYEFTPGESGDEILGVLSRGETIPALTITVPEGLTLEQTAGVVEEQSGISAGEFQAAAERTDYGHDFLDDSTIRTTEGFLFPKQYEFERDTDARQIVDRFLRQYVIETEDLDFAEPRGGVELTEYEIITMASLIEKESANQEERPIIASVIYNRIQSGMPLQVDASILYVLDEPKENLKLSDLEIDSPYNTYTNIGLPPGPIASPSRESIEAALRPAETDYLYYVLQAGGEEHFFTNDYNEFLEAKDEAEEER
ncbi:MAG: FIG004453: protein YceG like [uncultured Rubrobacteraceae bacterium]|uniref:Endolytic murein transglycosylase n=1 Tax=uncultured Rubrobacteraceae bacterium TaxID=349277 RepID=A0A6J4QRZ5_9ACTN|nr:MAG: FIG004453: protein YceG like [uncultured Rubrobacteraceae bacterium]